MRLCFASPRKAVGGNGKADLRATACSGTWIENDERSWRVTASVLDSWALIAWLQAEEPAASAVRDVLDRASRNDMAASMCLINVGEVFYLIARRKGAAVAERFLAEFPMMP